MLPDGVARGSARIQSDLEIRYLILPHLESKQNSFLLMSSRFENFFHVNIFYCFDLQIDIAYKRSICTPKTVFANGGMRHNGLTSVNLNS